MTIDDLNEGLKCAVLRSGLARLSTVHIFPLLKVDDTYHWFVDVGSGKSSHKAITAKDLPFMENVLPSLHNKLNGICRNLEVNPNFKFYRASDYEKKPLVFMGYRAVKKDSSVVKMEDPIKKSEMKKTIIVYSWEKTGE